MIQQTHDRNEQNNLERESVNAFKSRLGTSLPELVVDVTARRTRSGVWGCYRVMFGGASLSLGIGPLIAPTMVTAALAVRGAIAAISVMFKQFSRKHERKQ